MKKFLTNILFSRDYFHFCSSLEPIFLPLSISNNIRRKFSYTRIIGLLALGLILFSNQVGAHPITIQNITIPNSDYPSGVIKIPFVVANEINSDGFVLKDMSAMKCRRAITKISNSNPSIPNQACTTYALNHLKRQYNCSFKCWPNQNTTT